MTIRDTATAIVQMVLLVVAVLVVNPLTAAPARRLPQTVRQPDGSTLTIVQQGDEWHHWVTDLEGRLLVTDAEGYYRVADSDQHAEWQQRQQAAQSRRQEFSSQLSATRSTSMRSRTRTNGAPGTNHLLDTPTRGKIREVVILVEFADIQFSDQIDQHQYYHDFLMKPGFSDLGSNGSVHDYFFDNSMGVFDPQFDVFGPVRLEQPEEYYGANNYAGNDKRAAEMIIDACKALDEEIDFSLYDNDHDGLIDVVHVIYAGEGENTPSADSKLIWPHSWSISRALKNTHVELDGKVLENYMCASETIQGTKDGIGVFCHEFCHTLGLSDVYNTAATNETDNTFDIMHGGLYLGGANGTDGEGRCPCAMTAYERYELGWLVPEPMLANKYNYDFRPWKDTIQIDDHLSYIVSRIDSIPVFAPDTLLELTTSNTALLLQVRDDGEDPRDGEYYIFENRQQIGWDRRLHGHGMLAWHIDFKASLWESNTVNNSANHPCIQMVKANAQPHSAGMAKSDPFPGSKEIREFSATTTPALLGWDRQGSGSGMKKWLDNAALTDIREASFPYLSPETVVLLSYTNDGPQHFVGIEDVFVDGQATQISSYPRRVWRNGQLLIETSAGLYDLQGRILK